MREVVRCPRCGAEWERCAGREAAYYAFEDLLARRWPIRKGRCRACVLDGVGVADRIRFVEEEGLEKPFLEWLAGDLRADDARAVWALLVGHDRELLDVRLEEFIGEEFQDAFGEWAL